MEVPTQTNDSVAEKAVKNMNKWLVALVAFIIIYSVLMLFVIDKRTNQMAQIHPIILIDPNTMQINSAAYTNLIPSSFQKHNGPIKTNVDTKTNTSANKEEQKPMFEQKDSYAPGDFVVINFFYVECIITAKVDKDHYKLMYKDHNHVLQEIVMHRVFLLSPTSYNVVSPVSLLVD